MSTSLPSMHLHIKCLGTWNPQLTYNDEHEALHIANADGIINVLPLVITVHRDVSVFLLNYIFLNQSSFTEHKAHIM